MSTRLIQSSIIIVMFLQLLSCKKENAGSTAGNQDPLRIDDGPASASFGKRISYTGAYHFTWGKNSGELIASADQKLVRIDLLNADAEVVAKSQVGVTGRNHDNSSLILLGEVNRALGYYEYSFDTKKIEKIISVQQNDGTIFNKSGNNIFYYSHKIQPQETCDGFCWGNYFWPDSTERFIYLDVATNNAVPLPGKRFICFAKDGSKALLNTDNQFFIFDLNYKKVVDSFSFNYTGDFFAELNSNTIFYDSEPLLITADVSGKIDIRKLRTSEIVQTLPAMYQYEFKNFHWSGDGSKIYYIVNYLGIYDLVSKEEKKIAIPAASLDHAELSPDNKRILLRYNNEYYFRDIN